MSSGQHPWLQRLIQNGLPGFLKLLTVTDPSLNMVPTKNYQNFYDRTARSRHFAYLFLFTMNQSSTVLIQVLTPSCNMSGLTFEYWLGKANLRKLSVARVCWKIWGNPKVKVCKTMSTKKSPVRVRKGPWDRWFSLLVFTQQVSRE